MSGRGMCARVAVGDASARRAFSLIEILVSILILSLGLLGLGALFPVVIREQRLGTDAINGLIVANSARAMLTGVDWMQQVGTTNLPSKKDPTYSDRWLTLMKLDKRARTIGVSGGPGGVGREGSPEFYNAGGWWIPRVESIASSASFGSALLDISVTPFSATLEIPLEYRLYPAPGSGQPPQYVWDFALQRVAETVSRDAIADRLRIAVFVRRIDPGIRLPPRSGTDYDRLSELTKALLNTKRTSTGPDPRVPVGEDAQGRQTGDGTDGSGGVGNYSRIRETLVRFDPVYRDRLYMQAAAGSPAADLEWEQVGQQNQRIIDNLGNVYSVVGAVDESGVRYLKLDPSVPTSVPDKPPTTPAATDPAFPLFSIAYVPQVPVSVQVFEVKP